MAAGIDKIAGAENFAWGVVGFRNASYYWKSATRHD
jgi:hypothetical protein